MKPNTVRALAGLGTVVAIAAIVALAVACSGAASPKPFR